ncbi:Lysophospholipid acyltransferase [Dictyocoela muelleri]|nr:Lysophospholipid acyltransferase [Dictyocoela muelleri]
MDKDSLRFIIALFMTLIISLYNTINTHYLSIPILIIAYGPKSTSIIISFALINYFLKSKNKYLVLAINMIFNIYFKLHILNSFCESLNADATIMLFIQKFFYLNNINCTFSEFFCYTFFLPSILAGPVIDFETFKVSYYKKIKFYKKYNFFQKNFYFTEKGVYHYNNYEIGIEKSGVIDNYNEFKDSDLKDNEFKDTDLYNTDLYNNDLYNNDLYNNDLNNTDLNNTDTNNYTITIHPISRNQIIHKIFVSFIYAIIYIMISSIFPYSVLLKKSTFINNLFKLHVICFGVRCKYYFIWKFTSACFLLYEIKATNICPGEIEFSDNLGQIIRKWNIYTHKWLKIAIYKPLNSNNPLKMYNPFNIPPKMFANIMTFIFSALWHGINLCYFLMFISIGFMVSILKNMNFILNLLLSDFIIVKKIIKICIIQFIMAYFGMPFYLLSIEKSIIVYKKLYFVGHFFVAGLIFFGIFKNLISNFGNFLKNK